MKKRIYVGLLVLALLATGVAFGASDDPLISLSYLEMKLEALKVEILSSGGASSDKFEVVFVEEGKKITFGHSTEVILRAGAATAIVSDLGGLANVTTGIDLGKAAIIPKNHHLIIPRDDGRGFTILKDAYIMVKGTYTIIE